MKTIVLSFALMFFSVASTYGQPGEGPHLTLAPSQNYQYAQKMVNIEGIDKIPQITKSLCWSASVLMVVKYHDNSIKLSDVLKKRYPDLPADFTISDKCSLYDFSGINPIDSVSQTVRDIWDSAIESEGSSHPNQQRETESLISNLGFYSNEDAANYEQRTTLNWDLFKNQIEHGSPFIVTIFGADPYERHMIVVKGYWEKGGRKFLIVYDPLGNCKGQMYSIDLEILMNSESHVQLRNFIVNIHPKKSLEGIVSASERVPSRDMISDPRSRERYLMTVASINIDSVLTACNNTNAVGSRFVKVSVVDTHKLMATINIDSVPFLKYEMKDLVVDDNTVFRLQKYESDNKWHLMKVMENNYRPNGFVENLPEEFIIYPAMNQSFFKSRDENGYHLKPEFNLTNIVYKYKKMKPLDVILGLKKETQISENKLKKMKHKIDYLLIDKTISDLNRKLDARQVRDLQVNVSKMKAKTN